MTGYDFPTHIANKVDQAHTKVENLTERVTSLEKDSAVSAVRHVNMQTSLIKIENSLSKVVWLIITAIVGGIMAFLLRGGLGG